MGSVALVGAAVSAAAWASAAVRPSRLADVARLVTLAFGLLAVAALAHDLVTVDPASRYVARFSSDRTPLPYRLAGLWGGMEGSMLTWSVVVAVCFVIARSPEVAARRWIDGVGGALTATFFGVTALWASPFARLDVPTGRGDGLPAVLQHPAMLYHPPILYTGLALTMVPMARSIAALADRRLDDRWRAGVVTWMWWAWLVLGLGLVLGSNWAYAELGWGGFWAWDPVENAGLVPWLVLTAAIHAALAAQRVAAWATAALAIGAGIATIFGVYVTRSGGTGSIHAFASSPTIGRALLVLASATAVLGVWALARVHPTRWEWRGRDGVLLVQVVALTSVALLVAAGTFGPIVGGLFGGRPGVVRPDAYATALIAPAVVVVVGAAIGPSVRGIGVGRIGVRRIGARRIGVLATGATVGGIVAAFALVALDARRSLPASVILSAAIVSAATSIAAAVADQSARRVGVAISHAGFAVLLAGAAGTALGTDTSLMVPVGETASGPHATVTLYALEPRTTERYEAVRSVVAVDGIDHRFAPELRAYDGQPLPTAEAAFDHRWLGDTIVVMSMLDDDLAAARITVRDRPLINLVWWGAATTLTGAAVAAIAHRRRRGGDRIPPEAARTRPGAGRSRSATSVPRTTATTAADATSRSR